MPALPPSPTTVVEVDRTVNREGRLALGGHNKQMPSNLVGKQVTLYLEELWIRNVTITTGLVDTYSAPTLLTMLGAGQLDVSKMVTHRFGFDEFMTAYDVFADAAGTGALKVVVSRN